MSLETLVAVGCAIGLAILLPYSIRIGMWPLLQTLIEQWPRTFVTLNRRYRNPWQWQAWWRL